MDLVVILQLLVVGVFAGLLAGIFGVGGGLVVVPMLILLLPGDLIPASVATHSAIATSLACIVFTGAVSAWRHYVRGGVVWPVARWLGFGVIIGASLGAKLSTFIAAHWLQVMLVLFEIFVALRLLHPKHLAQKTGLRPLKARSMVSVGAVIGLVSSWLGIGGGTMSVPYLRWFGLDMRQAVGSSALVGIPIALAASFTFMLMTPLQGGMPAYSLGYVYFPALLNVVVGSVLAAPVGVRLAHRIEQTLLQRAFAVLLLGFAAVLLIKA